MIFSKTFLDGTSICTWFPSETRECLVAGKQTKFCSSWQELLVVHTLIFATSLIWNRKSIVSLIPAPAPLLVSLKTSALTCFSICKLKLRKHRDHHTTNRITRTTKRKKGRLCTTINGQYPSNASRLHRWTRNEYSFNLPTLLFKLANL